MKFRVRKDSSVSGGVVFKPGHKERMKKYIASRKEGAPIKIEMTQPQKVSDPYRRYYFGVVLKKFMAGAFYEPHEGGMFHEQLKELYFTSGVEKYCNVKPDERGFKKIPNVFHTKKGLTVKKQIKFVDWVIRLASNQNIYIPDPNE